MRAVLRDKTRLPRHGRIEFELGATLVPSADDWPAAVRLRDTHSADASLQAAWIGHLQPAFPG